MFRLAKIQVNQDQRLSDLGNSRKRARNENTIHEHLSHPIELGVLKWDTVIPPEIRKRVLEAKNGWQSTGRISAIMKNLAAY